MPPVRVQYSPFLRYALTLGRHTRTTTCLSVPGEQQQQQQQPRGRLQRRRDEEHEKSAFFSSFPLLLFPCKFHPKVVEGRNIFREEEEGRPLAACEHGKREKKVSSSSSPSFAGSVFVSPLHAHSTRKSDTAARDGGGKMR